MNTVRSMLYDIGEYKENLMRHLAKCPELGKVLLMHEPTEEERDGLGYSQIFPYLYVPDVQDEKKSYVCFEVNSSGSGSMKVMTLTVYILCHKDYMNYYLNGYQGTTVDVLCDIFTRQIEECKDFGIGKWDLSSTWHFFPNSSYYGRTLTFKISDFKNKVKKK